MMKHFLLFGLVSVALIGCKKDEVQNDPESLCNDVIYYDDEMAQQFYFKAGTYWVYEDANTATLDSLRISSVAEAGESSNCYSVVTLSSDGASHPSNEDIRFQVRGVQWRIRTGGNSGYQVIFDKEISSTPAYEGLSFLEEIPSIVVGDSTYTNVTKVQIAAGGAVFPSLTHLYICPNYGIVRKVEDAGGSNEKVFDLVRHHIVM